MVPKLAAKGTSFKGAAAYYLHDKGASTDERVAWTATANLTTDNPEIAWRIMAATAMDQAHLKEAAGIRATGRKSADVVLAYSLAWHPDEKAALTPEEMLLAARASLKALGAEHCQALIVAHADEPHPHVHIILNRVSPGDGRMLSSSKEKLNLSQWAEAYERGRGKIWCEERVANNQARNMLGEFTRATKDKARNRLEADRANGGLLPRESRRVLEIRGEQRTKDAALAAKGRDMHARHGVERDGLRKVHKDRRTAIIDKTRTSIGAARADVHERSLLIWRQLHKRHVAEERLFREREQRVTGKIQNAIAAIKSMGAVRGDASARGFLGTAFNYMTSAAKRGKALLQRQHGEKLTFALAQKREMRATVNTMRTGQRDSLRDNTKQVVHEQKALRASQDNDRDELRGAWRERNQDRGDALSKIEASRDLRRQVAERFPPQGRDQSGQDRGR